MANIRKQRKPNRIIKNKKSAKVELYNRIGEPVAYAIIDIEDIDKITGKKWCYHGGYAKHGPNGFQMHKAITGEVCDHINHNRLDNRKANLRTATHYQNMYNLPKPRHNSSGYVGVHFFKRTGLYRAYLSICDKDFHIGYFNTPEEAAYIRDQFVMQIRGNYAYLNFIY